MDDNQCFIKLWQDAVPYLSKGIPEINIPPVDPLKLENVNIDGELFEVNIIDGDMKGYNSCIVESYKWYVCIFRQYYL